MVDANAPVSGALVRFFGKPVLLVMVGEGELDGRAKALQLILRQNVGVQLQQAAEKGRRRLNLKLHCWLAVLLLLLLDVLVRWPQK